MCDFSPQLEAALRAAFPGAVIGHDYFHATQLLNRGLKKEMSRLYERECRAPAREYRDAARASHAAGRGELEKKPQFTQRYLQGAWAAFEHLHALAGTTNPGAFAVAWTGALASICAGKWPGRHALLPALEALVPKRGFTARNLTSTLDRARAAWRRVIREARAPLEKRATRFHRAKFLVMMNPANATPETKQLLREALAEYPWLRPLRKAVRDFHRQFVTGPEHWRPLDFLRKITGEDAHADLKSAVNTLVEKQAQIFAYREIWARYPRLRGNKGIRSNREEFNKRLNRVARNQHGIRSTRAARLRIRGCSACPTIVSQALMKKEASHP